ncbi:MAG: 30S ribosomal protein S20 [Minisyncoccia bacterium]
MPIIKSAKKALRSSQKKRVFNNRKKDQINKSVKQLKKLITENKIAEAKTFMSKVQKILDKSVKTGLIKKNTASRKKSRLSVFISKAK